MNITFISYTIMRQFLITGIALCLLINSLTEYIRNIKYALNNINNKILLLNWFNNISKSKLF